MIFDNAHRQQSPFFLKTLFSFLFVLLISSVSVVILEYIFSHTLAKSYYFVFDTVSKTSTTQRTAHSQARKKKQFKLEEHSAIYTVSSSLPVFFSEFNIEDIEEQDSFQEYKKNTLILNPDCLSSNVVQSQRYGVILACSDGRVNVLSIMSSDTSNKNFLLFNTIDVQKPILQVTWEQEKVLVFALDTALDDQNNAVENNISLYRFSRNETQFTQELLLPQVLHLDHAEKMFFIENVGTYINTVQGIALLQNKEVQQLIENANIVFAGGTENFYILHVSKPLSHQEKESYLSIYIKDFMFSLFEYDRKTTKQKYSTVYYDELQSNFIISNETNHYILSLKYE